MTRFADRYPTLFHVTWKDAVESIRSDGVLSAKRLCERHDHTADLTANRQRPVTVGPHLLRRQGMSNEALKPRLDPSITVEAWRSYINGLVFLFPTQAAAQRLAASEAVEQAILCFRTEHLLSLAELRVCRYNNGYTDRRPLTGARRRSFGDYVPIAAWEGTPVAEVVVQGCIPPGVTFTVQPSS